MQPADERATTQSTEIVLETFRAVEDRDLERLLSLYHPDLELVWPESLPYGGTFRGPTAVCDPLCGSTPMMTPM
jgi:ketosteroid isomerase-like protein